MLMLAHVATSLCCAQGLFVNLPDPPGNVSVESDDVPLSATHLIEQLKGTEPRAEFGLDRPVVLWPELVSLQTANPYGDPMRVLGIKLHIGNNSTSELSVPTHQIKLLLPNREIVCGSLPKDFPGYYVELPWEMLNVKELADDKSIEVPPGETRVFSAVFVPLPPYPSSIPLTLQIQLGEDVRTIDLRTLCNDRLKLSARRIGPQQVLGWLNIEGQLDSVNCQELASQLDQWRAEGLERFVISWNDKAPSFDENLYDWLYDALDATGDVNPVFVHMPKLRANGKIFLADLPPLGEEGNEVEMSPIYYSNTDQVYPSVADAVTASLRSIFEVAEPAIIRTELQSGHPLSRVALLRSVSSQLSEGDQSIILSMSSGEDETERLLAIESLGTFESDAVINRIEAALAAEAVKERKSAVLALLKSPHAALRERVTGVLDNPPVPAGDLIPLLVRYPHPAGAEFIRGRLHSDNAEERRQALQGLSALGHPQLAIILEEMLRDPDPVVRQFSFSLLSQRSDRHSERVSLDYALAQLGQKKLDETLRQFLQRVRDPRVGPLLIQLLDQSEGRPGLIELLGNVGDEQTAQELARRFPQFDELEQEAVLEALQQQGLPIARELAMDNINHDSPSVRNVAFAILIEDGGPETEHVLLQILRQIQASGEKPDLNEVSQLVEAIASLNGPDCRAALTTFRDYCHAKKFEDPLISTLEALKSQMLLSPGWNYAQVGLSHWRQDEFDEAIRYFTISLQFDPQLGYSHSALGNIYLKKDDLAKAREHFQQGFDLDPFDGQAITGLGIIRARQGEVEAAVKFTLDSAPKFKQDEIFAYNTGCVYGRAVEFLRTQPESEQRNDLIQTYSVAAVDAIGKSIELGFNDLDLFLSDPDIHSLREASGFAELVEKVRKAQ